MEQLNLRKNQVLDLKKDLGIGSQKAEVVLVLDYSGSMDHLYRTGAVQALVERILPLGMAFDDDGSVDLYLFHQNFIKIDRAITSMNISGYVDKYIYGSNGPKFNMGYTSYSPIISEITKRFATPGKGGGFLSRMFGPKETLPQIPNYPVYVIFITDGENDDKTASEIAIREAANYGIFWQFIGIGTERFNFLKKLDTLTGRKVDNANFFQTPALAQTSDDVLYKMLLTEFPQWLVEARKHSLIK